MESAMIVSAVNEVRPLISNKKINKGRCFQDVNKIFRNLPGVKFSLSKKALNNVVSRSKSDLDWGSEYRALAHRTRTQISSGPHTPAHAGSDNRSAGNARWI